MGRFGAPFLNESISATIRVCYNPLLHLARYCIPIGISSREAPFMLSLFLKKGIRSLDQDASMRWVRSRIIPSSRQNIEEILEKNKMDSYDEHTLLLKSEGRSCQDEFYIEEIPTS